MTTRITIIIAAMAAAIAPGAKGTDFINGDLDGLPAIELTMLPYSWQNVPDDDPVCQATNNSLGDTPDLTDMNGPSVFTGIYGNPYSGNSFVSGCWSQVSGTGTDFQEGIMQQLMGFVPGNTYTIVLHQATVKSYGCYDSSGSWAVYADNALAGITAPTTSLIAYDAVPFTWEERMIVFTATATYHTIKFLPYDDDTDPDMLGPNGALRMGIDLVSILPGAHTTGFGDDVPPIERSLWPNPIIDHLTVETAGAFAKGMVRIHSITGQLIGERTLASGGQRTSIDLSAIKPGAYIVGIVLDGIESRHFVLKE